MATLISQLAAGAIQEFLGMDNKTAVYYGVTWWYQP